MNSGTSSVSATSIVHRVVVFETGKRFVVRPASVFVSKIDTIEVTNLTAHTDMQIRFYPGAPLAVGATTRSDTLRISIQSDPGPLPGPYPYLVMLSNGDGKGVLAEGESAPHVIIDR